jgi:putative transposase
MLDVFSRYVVGWMVAHRESATLAEQFIRETCAHQAIAREQLTVHADRGAAMTSKPVALLLATSASPRRIAGRTCRTTTRSPRRSSRR